MRDRPTRRQWIETAVLSAGALDLLACRRQPARLVGDVPFQEEGRAPLDVPVGEELDGRLYTDLSQLDPATLVIPTAQFYIRTRVSHLLDAARPWSISAFPPSGPVRLSIDELRAQAQPQGVRLVECAGNTRAAHFGLISAASWDGVPLAPLLDRLRFPPRAPILVSGFDRYSAVPRTPSIPGASWIFSREQIEDAGAFLAIAMNGHPLTPDHGAPIRLVLPNWYGCASIKWVNEIRPADAAAAPTSQMQEYAARTMQRGLPELARDYQPAIIDPAAMPVRVEKWTTGGAFTYRVVGIVWGGRALAEHLEIRFRPDEPYVRVSEVQPAGQNPWSLWTHLWTPRTPGIYRIRLRLADSTIRTRRLDTGYYVRQVAIDQV